MISKENIELVNKELECDYNRCGEYPCYGMEFPNMTLDFISGHVVGYYYDVNNGETKFQVSDEEIPELRKVYRDFILGEKEYLDDILADLGYNELKMNQTYSTTA